jgi:hypothetical protein
LANVFCKHLSQCAHLGNFLALLNVLAGTYKDGSVVGIIGKITLLVIGSGVIDPDVFTTAHIACCVPLVGAGYNNARCYGQYVYGLLRFIVDAVLVFVANEDIVCGMGTVLIAIDIVEASIKVPVAIGAACGAVVVALQREGPLRARRSRVMRGIIVAYLFYKRCNYLLCFLLFDVAF